MASYLVTGGCGFIGSHLVDALLADGHRVRILDDLSTGKRANVPASAEIMVADVVDRAALRAAFDGVDGCFHLAAIASVQRSNEDWSATHRVNLGGTVEVFSAALRSHAAGPVPVVYASSAAVYGDNDALPLSETAAPRPLNAYAADKLGGEQHARIGAAIHGLPTVGLRLFNVYGPRQDPSSPYSGVISIFADRVIRGRTVEVYGDGLQTRDFVYVADCVGHFRAAMEMLERAGSPAPSAELFNVCTGRATTLLDLIDHLGKIVDRRARHRHGPARPGDIRNSLGDPRLAREALGMATSTTLTAGLAQLVEASPFAH